MEKLWLGSRAWAIWVYDLASDKGQKEAQRYIGLSKRLPLMPGMAIGKKKVAGAKRQGETGFLSVLTLYALRGATRAACDGYAINIYLTHLERT